MNGADRAPGRHRTPSAQVASELLNAAESVLDTAATYRALMETILRGLAGNRMGNTE
jgi:hypothetical protein